MEVETNPRTAWTHWMGTEMTHIYDYLWPSFLKETFQLLIRYRDQCKDLRQQQAPGPSNQPPVPPYLPRWQHQQPQQQQWQPQQTQFTPIQMSTPGPPAMPSMLHASEFSFSGFSNLLSKLRAAELDGGAQVGA